jgi:Na+-transporting NADH:ubiquinone oxidoreductase subunit A
MDVRIRRGLDIRVRGGPGQVVGDGPEVTQVALQGADYPGVRPAIAVEVGERVARGQTLFVDRHRPDIAFAAPAAGEVVAIERGPRRSLASLVVRRDGDDQIAFDPPAGQPSRQAARALLLKSGLWPAFVARPFGRIPDVDASPDAIFVTAMDTNPLAADAAVVLAPHLEAFHAGLQVLAVLTDGLVYVCQSPGPALGEGISERIRTVRFKGPHPAGLPGTHIHRLAPVGGGRTVWQINYQDAIAVGVLFNTGSTWSERVVSIAGPAVAEPALVRTLPGADIDELIAGNLKPGAVRVVSGSLLSGRRARYLGRYHQQVSVLFEGWGEGEHSRSRFWRSGRNTALNGRPGPVVPIAAYERVMPFDILPVPLLRALSVGDDETAARLGCLELLEEDVALLSYVCPGKTDYGPLLRRALDALAEAG